MPITWATDAKYLVQQASIEKVEGGWQTETRVYSVELGNTYTLQNALDAAPAIGSAHPDGISGIEVREVSGEPTSTPERCHITIKYGPEPDANRRNAYGEIWDWSLATEQQKVTAVERAGTSGPQTQTHYNPSGLTQRHIGRAIGVDGDNIEGTDVYKPALSLKLKVEFDAEASVPGGSFNNWLDLIAQTLGKIDASFRSGYQSLLIGSSDLGRNDRGKWGASYEILLARNPGSVSVQMWDGTDEVPVVMTINGWDYVWFTHGKKMISAGIMKSVILEGHVARVYDTVSTSFNTALGIQGTY